jgi:hypothetical protein
MPSCWGDPSTAKYQASIGWRIIAYSVMANNLTRKLILVMRTRKMKNPALTCGLKLLPISYTFSTVGLADHM